MNEWMMIRFPKVVVDILLYECVLFVTLVLFALFCCLFCCFVVCFLLFCCVIKWPLSKTVIPLSVSLPKTAFILHDKRQHKTPSYFFPTNHIISYLSYSYLVSIQTINYTVREVNPIWHVHQFYEWEVHKEAKLQYPSWRIIYRITSPLNLLNLNHSISRSPTNTLQHKCTSYPFTNNKTKTKFKL